jgi:hypothetical protein
VGSEKDNLSSCPEADELLPARSGEPEHVHAQACPRCGELVRERAALAEELSRLPRVSASREAAVDFSLVLRAVHGSLDAELVRDEARWRPLFAGLERLELPAAAESAIAARALPATTPDRTRSGQILVLVRRAAAFAAAAGVVAAALLSRSAPSARTGLAAETARLSNSQPIKVDLVDAPVPADATAAARILGNNLLLRREGGP